MALFEVIIPQLLRCGQQCGQGLESLMDQDWNHWKLQVQSWMEDAKEQSQSQANAGQSCGRRCQQNPCSDPTPDTTAFNPLNELLSQFMGGQTRRPTPGQASNDVTNTPKKLVIKLDVQHFEPSEIVVKIVDNYVVVSGEHPEKTDRFGLVSRSFQRRYELPENVETESIVSTLTPNGVLIIEGLKKSTQPESGAEIVIPVIRQQTSGSGDDPQSYETEQQMD